MISVGAGLLAWSCSSAEMKGGQGRVKECKPTPTKPCNVVISDPTPVDDPFVPEGLGLSPALATRKSNCVLCHGTVSGDVITDFNVADNPFGSRDVPGSSWDQFFENVTGNVDGLRPENWATVNIQGKLVIPNATISGRLAKAFNNNGAEISLINALRQEIIQLPENVLAAFPGRIPIPTVGESRDKSKAGVNEISVFGKLQINPPSEDEIGRLLTASYAKPLVTSEAFKIMGLGAQARLTGFIVKKGLSGQNYAINQSSVVDCEGDIVFSGTLVLKDLSQMNVGPSGCRLYVQHSVFIKGSVVATGGSEGLQIGAGRAIIAGIRYGRTISDAVNAESQNVADDIEDAGLTYYLTKISANGTKTRLATTPYSYLRFPGGAAEFSKASASHWTWLGNQRPPSGAVCQLSGTTVTTTNGGLDCSILTPGEADDDQSISRKTATYDGVIFAAPQVQSRYFGSIKGAIVADFTLFSLNRLNFQADQRFNKKPALPYLGRPILVLEK
jgi:hypothetical protein